MATGPGSLSRHLHFAEFNSPLPTGSGGTSNQVLTPAQRRGAAKQNLGSALALVSGGIERVQQVAPDTVSVTGTLTTANILKGLLLSNPAAGQTLTMASGTDLDAAISNPSLGVDEGFVFQVKNLSANALTLAVGAGNTNGGIAGDLTVAASGIATFIFRKTAANAFTLYRVS